MKKIILAFFVLLVSTIVVGQSINKTKPKSVGIDIKHLSLADNIINKAIDEGETPGAVLAVVRHGKLAYLKAYGNKQTYPIAEAMKENTVFDLASLSKSISTALSAMILIERGQLRLADNVSLYIPDFQQWEDSITHQKKTIRVINLLTHTSGLPPYASIDELKRKYTNADNNALINYIATAINLNTEPGTNFDYSCLNFITLQRIIENISGQTLQQFAQENIFKPLGMKHTDYNPTGETLQWTAPTEKQPDGSVLLGQVHDPLARIVNKGVSGNAGVFSNAEDLAILSAMLLNGGEYKGTRILSPLSVKALQTVPRGYEQFGRSLGWDNYSPYASNNGDLFSGHTYGHTGYTGTSLIIDPDNDTAVILLTNRVHPEDKGGVVRLRGQIANIVAGSIIK